MIESNCVCSQLDVIRRAIVISLVYCALPNGTKDTTARGDIDRDTGMVLQAQKFKVPAGNVAWKVRMRACVWYSRLLGKPPAETARDLSSVFGNDAIKAAAVHSLYRQFRDGRQELLDLKRSGRPPVETAPAKIDQVKDLVTQQPRTTIAKLAHRAGLKSSTTEIILKKKLKLCKRSCKLVPHTLTDVQKVTSVKLCPVFAELWKTKVAGVSNHGWRELVLHF